MGWRSQFRQAWRGERDLPPYATYVTVLALAALATAFRWSISTIRPDVLPFTPYFPAIIFATLLAGRKAGIFAALIGAALGLGLHFGPPVSNAVIFSALIPYALAASVFIWGADHFRSIAMRHREQSAKLEKEEDFRKLIVGEMEHRLKNKLATVHAVLHQILRDQPQVWATVDNRIQALARTDELIRKTDGQSLDLEALLKQELEPYDSSRVSFLGEPVRLPSKLAITLALIFHEMATNAAKYGAFTLPGGRLQISWRKTGQRLSVTWDETSTTGVKKPTKQGFGQTLMDTALSGFDGKVFCDYLASGLHCTVTCAIPQDN